MDTTAFFDLDYTLLNISSSVVYVKESLKQRRLPLWLLGVAAAQYKIQGDFGQAHARLIPYVGRHGRAQAAPFFTRLVNDKILPHLTLAGQAKIAWHQAQGQRVVIISASIEELVRPIAAHLGVDYLCSRLAVQADRYTGQLEGPVCHGPGKIYWAKTWAAQNGLDFSQTIGYFYTDSSSDLPLLELAAHPVAVNPSRKLAKIARARGWTIEKFY